MASNKNVCNEITLLKSISDDPALFKRFTAFAVEINTCEKNVAVAKRDLKEVETKFKEELGVPKNTFKAVLAYAKASFQDESTEDQDKELVIVCSELGDAIAREAEANKEVKNMMLDQVK